MNNKKRNNKGFSLVELIVVVAIMAVLVGVLAPAYLKYVENSRINKDETTLEEVRHAVEIAVAEETIYDDVTFGTTTLTITVDTDGNGTIESTSDLLEAEVESVVGETVKLDSKEYKAETGTIDYVVNLTSQTEISGSWEAESGS